MATTLPMITTLTQTIDSRNLEGKYQYQGGYYKIALQIDVFE